MFVEVLPSISCKGFEFEPDGDVEDEGGRAAGSTEYRYIGFWRVAYLMVIHMCDMWGTMNA